MTRSSSLTHRRRFSGSCCSRCGLALKRMRGGQQRGVTHSSVRKGSVCVTGNKKEGRSEKKKQNLNRYVVSDMHKDTKVIHEMTIVRKRGSTTDARSRRHCTGQATCLTVPYRLPVHQKLRGTLCTSPKSYQKPL